MATATAIQVGLKILRTPSGDSEKVVGLFVPASPELTKQEAELLGDLAAIKAKAMHDYIEARKAVKRQSK